MLRIIISGCNGHMGQSLVSVCAGHEDIQVIAGFNRTPVAKNDFPVYSNPMEYTGEADVVVDFSNPANLDGLLNFSVERGVPLILCTTGFSEEQAEKIKAASEKVPVFRSGNMSIGINLMLRLVRSASAVLGDAFNVEILEMHHNRKVDAPSGTAVMLADAAADALPYKPNYVYERHSVRKKRSREDIGISSIRGGSIVGEHDVIFAGPNEVLTIKHEAQSREIFANGAVAAVRFMAGVKKPGYYTMDDVLADALG